MVWHIHVQDAWFFSIFASRHRQQCIHYFTLRYITIDWLEFDVCKKGIRVGTQVQHLLILFASIYWFYDFDTLLNGSVWMLGLRATCFFREANFATAASMRVPEWNCTLRNKLSLCEKNTCAMARVHDFIPLFKKKFAFVPMSNAWCRSEEYVYGFLPSMSS